LLLFSSPESLPVSDLLVPYCDSGPDFPAVNNGFVPSPELPDSMSLYGFFVGDMFVLLSFFFF
jgi:hypothetical protein